MKMGLLSLIRKKRVLALGIALLLGASLLAGCASKGGAEKGGSTTLYIGMTNAPDSFNPLFNPGIAGIFAIRFMYDTLLCMPSPNEFKPGLADSFETTDNQNYIIKVNPKAKWSDGQPITAQDVVYTLNLIANPKVESTKGSRIAMLEGVNSQGKFLDGVTVIPDLVAVDDHTVTFKTKTPVDPNYVKGFLGFEVFIVPKHVFEKLDPATISNSEAATKPSVTSGPYKFVAYKTNDNVEFAANDEYYKGAPKLKKIFLRIMNGTNLVTELKSGGIQMVAGDGIGVIPIKDLDMLKKDNKLVVNTTPTFGGQYLEANNQKFNTKFRQALTTAINRKQIVDQLFKGAAKLVPTVYTMPSPVYDKNVIPLPYDTEKAKQLLAESGFDTSQELTLDVPIGNVLREQSADLIQQDLTAIGLKVKQQKLDFPTLLAKAKKGDYELLLLGYGLTVDPDYSSYFVPGGSNNYAQVNDPKLTEMFNKAAVMTSADERKVAYSAIQQYLKEQQFIISLYAPDYINAQSKDLHGGIGEFWDGSLYNINEWTLDAK
jgi:peptide/nickel transport system substrate-binding protein